MTDRAYNRVANALMVIGVASALAFDSGRVPHIVAGGIGIIAGVGALILYFCGGAEAPKKEEVKTEQMESLKARDVVVSSADPKKVFFDSGALHDAYFSRNVPVLHAHHHGKHTWAQALWKTDVDAIEAYRRETAQLWLFHYALNHARKLHWLVIDASGACKPLMEPEVELSPNEVAACAIEIILGFAKSDKGNRWEYSMGPKGLRIAARRSSPMRPVMRVTQNDFDFGDITMAYSDASESSLRDPS
jgi:hypothetical protein